MIAGVQIQSVGWRTQAPIANAKSLSPDVAFSAVLERSVQAQETPQAAIRFSNHARQRMTVRGITLNDADMSRIERASDEAASKGARQSLLLMNQAGTPDRANGENRLALLLSVPNRTVITVVPQSEMEDSVFTNIDSAVVVADDASTLVDDPFLADTSACVDVWRSYGKNQLGRTPDGEAPVPPID